MPSLLRPLCSLVAILFFCLGGFSAADEIVVISPHPDEVKEETARAFSAWHQQHYGRPVTIRWYEAGGGTSQIIRLLTAEYKSNPAPGIDVLYGGGTEPFISLAQQGLLTPFDPPPEILAPIPAQLNGMPLYDPGHQWFGAALSGFGIITNERSVCPRCTPGPT